jgi:hypothetical protein
MKHGKNIFEIIISGSDDDDEWQISCSCIGSRRMNNTLKRSNIVLHILSKSFNGLLESSSIVFDYYPTELEEYLLSIGFTEYSRSKTCVRLKINIEETNIFDFYKTLEPKPNIIKSFKDFYESNKFNMQ